ncbi:unnamed protein product [Cuscuta campestris]|uniref:Uncharacterized protein n=1 Tax=Cuscuta campestris TaxID=132261 RepID=A0A484KRH5_9ASTE|nr:unnamed protein product [Cuscuta campestris]
MEGAPDDKASASDSTPTPISGAAAASAADGSAGSDEILNNSSYAAVAAPRRGIAYHRGQFLRWKTASSTTTGVSEISFSGFSSYRRDDDTWKEILCENFDVVSTPAQGPLDILLKLALLPATSPAAAAAAAAASLETLGDTLADELESKKALFYGNAEGDYRGPPLNMCAALILSSSSSRDLLASSLGEATLVLLSKCLNWRLLVAGEVAVRVLQMLNWPAGESILYNFILYAGKRVVQSGDGKEAAAAACAEILPNLTDFLIGELPKATYIHHALEALHTLSTENIYYKSHSNTLFRSPNHLLYVLRVLSKTSFRRDLDYASRFKIHEVTQPFLPVINADPEASAQLLDDLCLTLLTRRPN